MTSTQASPAAAGIPEYAADLAQRGDGRGTGPVAAEPAGLEAEE